MGRWMGILKTVPRKNVRRKHIPLRTCVGCRRVLPKKSLIRIVRTPQGIEVDPTGKLPGRGAYLHDLRSCWERGLKGALSNALMVEFTPADRERLMAVMNTLPNDIPEPKAVQETE